MQALNLSCAGYCSAVGRWCAQAPPCPERTLGTMGQESTRTEILPEAAAARQGTQHHQEPQRATVQLTRRGKTGKSRTTQHNTHARHYSTHPFSCNSHGSGGYASSSSDTASDHSRLARGGGGLVKFDAYTLTGDGHADARAICGCGSMADGGGTATDGRSDGDEPSDGDE